MTMPTLATGAVQQYPYTAGAAGKTRVLRLADGSEQRYLERPPRLSWSVQLRLLGDGERQAFLDFAQLALRTQATFAYTDPATGMVHPSCRMAVAPVSERIDGVARTALGYVIVEVGA
jgi:hypothetical protein